MLVIDCCSTGNFLRLLMQRFKRLGVDPDAIASWTDPTTLAHNLPPGECLVILGNDFKGQFDLGARMAARIKDADPDALIVMFAHHPAPGDGIDGTLTKTVDDSLTFELVANLIAAAQRPGATVAGLKRQFGNVFSD